MSTLAAMLTEEARTYYPAGMIAAEVLPSVTVTNRLTDYWHYSRATKEPIEKRTASLYEYALECRPQPQEDMGVLKRQVRRCFDKIYLDYELRASTLLRDASNYPVGHYVTVAGVRQWDKLSESLVGSDYPLFLDTINMGVDAIRNHTGGLLPNTIILAHPAADAFRNWVARTPDNAYDDKPGLLHPKHLRIVEGTALFAREPDKVQGLRATNPMREAGASMQMEWVWGNDAILAYIAPAPAIDQMTLGITMRLPDANYIKVLPSDTDDIDIVEAVRAGITGQQEVLIAPDCGFLIRNVVGR